MAERRLSIGIACIPFVVAWANLFARVTAITTGKLSLAHATRDERHPFGYAPIGRPGRSIALAGGSIIRRAEISL